MEPKSLRFFKPDQSDGEENYYQKEEDKVEKVPIYPKLNLIQDVLLKNEARCSHQKEKKKSEDHKKKKITKEEFETLFQKDKGCDIQKKFSQQLSKEVRQINGNRIEGCWRKDALHGYAEIKYESGEYFIGKYINGVRTEGLVKFKDGTEYWGGFEKDLFHGKGSLKEPSGRILTSEWVSGRIEGKVRIEYPSGDTYYGEVKELKKHGKGYLFFQNGKRYVGSFDDGTITGLGAYYEGQNLLAEGIWKDGILQIPYFTKQILQKHSEEIGLIKKKKTKKNVRIKQESQM